MGRHLLAVVAVALIVAAAQTSRAGIALPAPAAPAATTDPAPTAAADPAPAAPAVKEEVVEEVVEVADVSPVAAPASTSFTATVVAGRMHPAAVHIPIGGFMIFLLVELLSLFVLRVNLERYGTLALGATLLSALAAVGSGLLRADELATTAADRAAAILVHRNIMFGFFALVAVILVIRVTRGARLTGILRVVYVALLLAAAALVAVGGHLGGKMIYGDNYLPF